jgi:predicted DNA-binding transcriptional regulator AlpA
MYEYLVKTYGLRLNMEQLAEALKLSRGSVYNKISAGTFKVPTYLDGQRWADARDVAAHLDRCRATANLPTRTSPPGWK